LKDGLKVVKELEGLMEGLKVVKLLLARESEKIKKRIKRGMNFI